MREKVDLKNQPNPDPKLNNKTILEPEKVLPENKKTVELKNAENPKPLLKQKIDHKPILGWPTSMTPISQFAYKSYPEPKEKVSLDLTEEYKNLIKFTTG